MPDDPQHLTLLDAHELDYDRRLFGQRTQFALEQHLAGMIHHGYGGQNIQEVSDLVGEWLAGQFPVRFSVLADEPAARLRQALGDCLLDWHMDLGSCPSSQHYWLGLAPEVLKRAVFTLAPEWFDFGPGSAAPRAKRMMSPELAFVATELRHHYRDLLPHGIARAFAWEFFHERYPREAAEAPVKVQTLACSTVQGLLEQWVESHRGLSVIDGDSLRAADLKEARGGDAIVLDEACGQIAEPIVRVFHVTLRPQSFRLPALWRYCAPVGNRER
jgi:hypothetical protein